MPKTPRQTRFNQLVRNKTPLVQEGGRKYVMPLGVQTMRG